MEDQLLSLKQVSEILHIHPSTLRRWDRSGALSSVRIGSRKDRHYLLRNVQKFIQSGSSVTFSSAQSTEVTTDPQPNTTAALQDVSQSLIRFGERLSKTDVQREIGELVSRQLVESLAGDTSELFLCNSTNQQFILFSQFPKETKKKAQTLEIKSKCPEAQAIADQSCVWIENEQDMLMRYSRPFTGTKRVKAQVMIPMQMAGKVIALCRISFHHERNFTESEKTMITIAAQYAASAIRRTELISNRTQVADGSETTKRMVRRINTAALQFLTKQTPEELFACISTNALAVLDAEHLTILLMRDGELQRVFSTSPVIAKTPLSKGGRTYQAFEQQEPLISQIKNPSDIHPFQRKLGTKTLVFIPLAYDHKNVGVMNVFCSQTRTFSSEEIRLLKLLGSLASLAIEQTSLRQQLEKSLKLHDLFMSFAAHELKTPLTVIRLYTQLIQNAVENKLLPDKKFPLIMLSEIVRMTKLINELLQVSQMRSNQFRYQMKECDLHGIIDHAIADFRAVFPDHSVRLRSKLTVPAPVICDADKLLQVFINILNNAGKFSPKDKAIVVEVTKEESTYILTIADHGPGIPQEHLKNIFHDFYKGDSSKEGMGLGLYIVKQIITKHGGDVRIESSKKGTTAHISLPTP